MNSFIHSLVLSCFFALVLLSAQSVSFAQSVDTTIKPLPDFIQDRPEVEVAPEESTPEPALSEESDDLSAPEFEREIGADLKDIPDEYIIEASKFADKCRNHEELPLMYDCRCMSVRYLDARIEFGPDASPSMVQNRLGGECKDATLMVGQLYESCLLDINNAPTHLDPEEFCTCYANKYGTYFESFPGRVPRMRRISLQAQAKLRCSNPTAARRVYGPDFAR